MSSSEIVGKVRDQYEDFPYPQRDPEEERSRLYLPFGGAVIEEINHYCFCGQKNFEDARILVAGAGTGDAVIHLAEQLRHLPNARVIYLDMSQASYDVARARADVRGLTNIDWHMGSLLDLPAMGIAPVDFINCSGVIHHLPDPDAGLAALASVLKPDGAIFLMVYATYGRHAIYHAQALFKDLLPEGLSKQEQINLAREWLEAFPKFSFMKANLHRWEDEISTDAGFLDMLLHSQDRSYTVDEAYDLAEDAGFTFVDFVGKSAMAYKLPNSIANKKLLGTVESRSKREKQALAERIFCNIPIHSFYISRNSKTVASIGDEANTIVMAMGMTGKASKLHQSIVPGQMMKFEFKGQGTIKLRATEVTKALASQLGTGLAIGQMIENVREELQASGEQSVRQEIRTLFESFNELGLMYLKNAALPAYSAVNYGPLG